MRLILAITLCTAVSAFGSNGDPVPVSVQRTDSGFQLLRAGQPFTISGAGGNGSLEELAAAGANSVRTWGDINKEFLDTAHATGLTVCVGLWVPHERHGFDFGNPEAVDKEFLRQCDIIDRFKDHPAVLMWGIGNEVELNYSDLRVWDFIESVAAYAKKVDPHHPTMTVIAQAPEEELHEIIKRCPSIDILGSNSYGGISVLSSELKAAGWDRPYVVAEWGTDGSWEADKTKWGAEIEADSASKARKLIERFGYISADGNCLGSYAFHWGSKQETTPTWFNFFLEDGAPTAAVDALTYLWTGEWPPNRSPEIYGFRINRKSVSRNLTLPSQSKATVRFKIRDDKDSSFSLKWECLQESMEKGEGGDPEDRPDPYVLKILESEDDCMIFRVPSLPGAYRLYLYAYDSEGRAATANFPFLVK